MELLIDRGGTDDIFQLAQRLSLEVDDLLPIVDAAQMLDFAQVSQGDVTVTPTGRAFANAEILPSKELFRQQVLARVPPVASIYQTLKEKRDRRMRADFFLDILDEHFPPEEVEQQFATVLDWDALPNCSSTTPTSASCGSLSRPASLQRPEARRSLCVPGRFAVQ